MAAKYERQMKKGVLEMLVLKLLTEEEKYGYQLISELSERTDAVFALREGTLYPVLYRLEEDGLVESNWSVPSGREAARKYYAITEQGKEVLQELELLWKEFSKQVNNVLGGKRRS